MTVDQFDRYATMNPVPDVDALPPIARQETLLETIDKEVARGWRVPSPRPRPWRGLLVASATMALVVVAGLVALLAANSGSDVTGGPGSTSGTPLDTGVETGSAVTPLGPVTWARASGGTPADLPRPDSAVEVPSGFAGVVSREDSTGAANNQWTTSPDGVTWTVQPFPVPVDEAGDIHVGAADGRYWLTDGVGLWLSNDADSWSPIDLSKFRPPPSTGLVWVSEVAAPPAIAGATTVISLTAHPVLPVAEIFDLDASDFSGGLRTVSCAFYAAPPCGGDDEHVVVGIDARGGAESVLARFRLEGSGNSAVVRDVDSGAPLHEFSLMGFRGDQLAGFLGTEYVSWNSLGVVGRDNSLSVIDSPWPSIGVATPRITAIQGRFVAHVSTGDPHRSRAIDDLEVWESLDGRIWTSRGTVDFGVQLSGETDVIRVVASHDQLIAEVEYDLGAAAPSMVRLRSDDGLTWQTFPNDTPALPEPLGSGFVAIGDRVWVSGDGSTWARLTLIDQPPDVAFVVGDILLVAYEIDGANETWAIDFAP